MGVAKKLKRKLLNIFSIKNIINYQNQGVLNFIDIGSIGGLPEPWTMQANSIKFLLNFEPNDQPIKKKNSTTYNSAVWEEDTELPFYVYKGLNQTGSSLFQQNIEYVEDHFEVLKNRGDRMLAETWFDRGKLINTLNIQCRKLDNIIAEEFPDTSFHFMKIDAQGAEYNILKGAENLLKNDCIGLHLELFTIPLYKNIILLDQVEEYLDQFGFKLIKKFPAHGTFLSQHDCLFLKTSDTSSFTTLIKNVYKIN